MKVYSGRAAGWGNRRAYFSAAGDPDTWAEAGRMKYIDVRSRRLAAWLVRHPRLVMILWRLRHPITP